MTSFHATLFGLPFKQVQDPDWLTGLRTIPHLQVSQQSPRAQAGVIPNLLPDKATSKAVTNLLRFGARVPPASDGSTRV